MNKPNNLDSLMPNFSIVIPTNKTKKYLLKTISLLSQIAYNGKWEAIIVQNRHTTDSDSTEQWKTLPNGKFISLTYENISNARNVGISQSKYNNIVFIDDDIEFSKNILNFFSKSLRENPDATAIGGKISLKSSKPDFNEWFTSYKHIPWIYATTDPERKKATLAFPDYLLSATLYVRKEKLIKELFNTKLGRNYNKWFIGAEDIELSLRLLARNHILVYDPNIEVFHTIKKEKMSFVYIIIRFLQTGIENKLMDKILAHERITHHSVQSQLDDSAWVIKQIIKTQKKEYLIYFLQKMLFLIGYYLLSPFVLESTVK